MSIREIRPDGLGIAEFEGVRREVDLSLVANPRVGNYVIVHAGYAISILDEREAGERLALFKEMAELGQPQTP